MAKPRELRRRIKSVQSTRKITKTMELVATSKLKRAQDRVVAARPYAAALAGVIGDLYAPELAERFPLLRQPGGAGGAGGVRHVALVVITSNRGLAGAFNANLIREGRRRIEQLESEGATVDLHLIGKKGITYFKFAKRPLAARRHRRQADGGTCRGCRESTDGAVRGGRRGRRGSGVPAVQKRGVYPPHRSSYSAGDPAPGGSGRQRAAAGGKLHPQAVRRG